MSIGASDWQQMILREIGAGLDGDNPPERAALDLVTPYITAYWAAWASKAYYPRLQYLYTKRQCIDVLLGQLRLAISKSLGSLSMSLDQKVAHLVQIREHTQSEIDLSEQRSRANRRPVVEQTNRKAPIEPQTANRQIIPGVFDPNDDKYRGSGF